MRDNLKKDKAGNAVKNRNNVSKRRFSELREIILRSLSEGQKTINQLSSETGINWKTVDNHLAYIVGKGYAKEIFSSRFVRIFEATEKGLAYSNGKGSYSRNNDTGKSTANFVQNGEVKIS
ncbi:MAG: ArsR family transcriptional regulator [Candidatus Woesearchaeota archaeon]|nr:ArsR family transcriptional regulator [Candidatus Woesearchaeota archaeon]